MLAIFGLLGFRYYTVVTAVLKGCKIQTVIYVLKTEIEPEKKTYVVSYHAYIASRWGPCECGATIKQHISTPALLDPGPLIAIASKHLVVPYRAHSFIVNVQPRFEFPTTVVTVPIRMEHVDRIVPASCRFAVVIEHPIQLVVYSRIIGSGCHDFWTKKATRDC
jgi:hypothetical protein